MARYRNVAVRIWNDEKFRALSDDGKFVFLFLLTHPHMTSLGAMRANEAGLAKEIDWDFERFSKAFQEGLPEGFPGALGKGLIHYSADDSFLALPNFLKHNPPQSPNVVRSWGPLDDLLPECPLKVELYARVRDFLEGFSKGFREALPKPFGKAKPLAKPYQEQEQEQELKEVSTTLPTVAPSHPSKLGVAKSSDVSKVMKHYQGHHPRARPGAAEKAKIKKRLQEGYEAAALCTSIDGYHQSPHHLGDNDRGREFLSLELIMRDSSHVQAGLEFAEKASRGDSPGRPRKVADCPQHPFLDGREPFRDEQNPDDGLLYSLTRDFRWNRRRSDGSFPGDGWEKTQTKEVSV